jgi:hypothetical protein
MSYTPIRAGRWGNLGRRLGGQGAMGDDRRRRRHGVHLDPEKVRHQALNPWRWRDTRVPKPGRNLSQENSGRRPTSTQKALHQSVKTDPQFAQNIFEFSKNNDARRKLNATLYHFNQHQQIVLPQALMMRETGPSG